MDKSHQAPQPLASGIHEAGRLANDQPKGLPVPRPSASVLVISPTNQVLLLQRVPNTTSFASAHVFPGGNLSTYHEGPLSESEVSHIDSPEYRQAAIRETFEESGLLLTCSNGGDEKLKDISPAQLEMGRRLVHGNKIRFTEWLAQKGRRADIDGLLPFTRWISPTTARRRFTTQMYVYFLPTLASNDLASLTGTLGGASRNGEEDEEVRILPITTDGGIEHTNAKFSPASAWCRLAQEGSIVLYPPQFFLLHHVAQLLDGSGGNSMEPEELKTRRKKLATFIGDNEGGDDVPWTEKCICPVRAGKWKDGREIMALHDPGPELQDTRRGGVKGSCMLFHLQKDGTRELTVIGREEAMSQQVKL